MKLRVFYPMALIWLLGSHGIVRAEEPGIVLIGIKAHPTVERTHVCKIVKMDEKSSEDCDDSKCASGGPAVAAALAAKGMKRVCRMKDASVNRGYDVTYAVSGVKMTVWTASDPEAELKRIGLSPFEEHSPLNPECAQMSFKEASTKSECSEMSQR
jgi:hypothetical protein